MSSSPISGTSPRSDPAEPHDCSIEPHAMNPLKKLNRTEILLLFDILRDACRERLEKNLLNQAFEERLAERGQVPGRVDPRGMLKRWEPRYRKLFEVATELRALAQASETDAFVEALSRRMRKARSSRAKAGISDSPVAGR
jgi:hypothetical protein